MADSTAGARPGAESVRLPKGWTALVIGTRSDMGTAIGPGRAGADAVGAHCRGLGFGRVPITSAALPGAAQLAADAGEFDARHGRGALAWRPLESAPPLSVARPSARPISFRSR